LKATLAVAFFLSLSFLCVDIVRLKPTIQAMHYLLASIGSLGDALPYLRIAQTLKARGHRVSFFSNEEHRALVESSGIEFFSAGTGLNAQEMIANPRLWQATKGLGVYWRGMLQHCIVPLYRCIEQLSQQAEPLHVIAGPHMLGARFAQEHLSVQLTSVYTSPGLLRTCIAPTTIAHITWPQLTPSWLLKFLWQTIDRKKLHPMARAGLAKACAEIGIKPPPEDVSLFGSWIHSKTRGVTLYPDWFAPVPQDQPRHIINGYFPVDTTVPKPELPEAVRTFLSQGSAPIVVTFGSAMLHAEQLFSRWQEALALSSQRGIFISPASTVMPAQSAHVLNIDYAPFETLLPHCQALVQHGGIGSCMHALISGIPQIMQPHAHDHFDNTLYTRQLHAALHLHRDATAPQMVRALDRLNNTAMQQSVKTLQHKIPADSLACLCDLFT
jgi:rhamnosyltransferase subunit B